VCCAPPRPSTRARLGAVVEGGRTGFALWAPTAVNVSLCLYPDARGAAAELQPLVRDAQTGVWAHERAGDLSGRSYTYLVDVHQRPAGLVRHRVGDPYALSLTADSRRSAILDLQAAQLKPAGWDTTPRPQRVQASTDLVIYELHVRDFSASDRTVSAANRGKYLAFTETASDGMRHLAAMARAGLTDLHPVSYTHLTLPTKA
jgi:pullulanase/glycogen debranching enzyme